MCNSKNFVFTLDIERQRYRYIVPIVMNSYTSLHEIGKIVKKPQSDSCTVINKGFGVETNKS